ncbi:hypothetical protein UR08_00300 [Listeria kieliensis]|uniref:Uncharacterized protein n=1 Tax=Listeria kieliensis TaxID=1621700 RepID=A0A3D8TSS1_9LIST|nr:hypothetical protein UR08_00300 [Listeria kieliensis]
MVKKFKIDAEKLSFFAFFMKSNGSGLNVLYIQFVKCIKIHELNYEKWLDFCLKVCIIWDGVGELI